MRKKDLTDLRVKTVEEIEQAAKDAQDALEKMKLAGVNGQVLNRIAIKNLKKDIAQILTILQEKKIIAK